MSNTDTKDQCGFACLRPSTRVCVCLCTLQGDAALTAHGQPGASPAVNPHSTLAQDAARVQSDLAQLLAELTADASTQHAEAAALREQLSAREREIERLEAEVKASREETNTLREAHKRFAEMLESIP